MLRLFSCLRLSKQICHAEHRVDAVGESSAFEGCEEVAATLNLASAIWVPFSFSLYITSYSQHNEHVDNSCSSTHDETGHCIVPLLLPSYLAPVVHVEHPYTRILALVMCS